MKRTLIAVLLTVGSAVVLAQDRNLAKVPERDCWNLPSNHPPQAACWSTKDKLAAELSQMKQYDGKHISSPQVLADALERQSVFDKELSRLYVYAGMLADQDTRDSQHEGMRQEMTQMAASFGAQTAFIEPELLRAGQATLDRFVASEPRLKVYAFY